MSAYVLALIPEYGLIIVFGVVAIACFGIPLPSSMLALAAGGFAATGDLVLWQVMGTIFSAFAVTSQIAFHTARSVGPNLLSKMKSYKKFEGLLVKSEALLEKRGGVAVLMSHTIMSPIGPYVTYICGASSFVWARFTVAALVGAALWTSAYVLLGYMFAGQLSVLTDTIGNLIGILCALAALVFGVMWLRTAWKKAKQQAA